MVYLRILYVDGYIKIYITTIATHKKPTHPKIVENKIKVDCEPTRPLSTLRSGRLRIYTMDSLTNRPKKKRKKKKSQLVPITV